MNRTRVLAAVAAVLLIAIVAGVMLVTTTGAGCKGTAESQDPSASGLSPRELRKTEAVVDAFTNGPQVPQPQIIPRPTNTAQCVEELGGSQAACRKLGLYLDSPGVPPGRRAAATCLLSFCGKEAVPELIRRVDDKDKRVHYWAVMALCLVKDSRSVAALERTARNDEDAHVRKMAKEALDLMSHRRAQEHEDTQGR